MYKARTRGQGGAVSGTCEGEFMNLSPQWLGAKVFCKIEAEEWRTCDVGKRCTPGAWFKIRVEDLLQPTAKIVRRKDGVLGYLPEVMERQVCCRLCKADTDPDPSACSACDWCIDQEIDDGREIPSACVPQHHGKESWQTSAEWQGKVEAGTDLPPNTQVRVRMKVMPGNNPYREWHMRCPDCHETLIVDRVGQPYVHAPGGAKENRSQASDLLRHMAGTKPDGSWKCCAWGAYVDRKIGGGDGGGEGGGGGSASKRRTVTVHPTEKLLATWRNTSRSLAMQALELLQKEVARELVAVGNTGMVSAPSSSAAAAAAAGVGAAGRSEGGGLAALTNAAAAAADATTTAAEGEAGGSGSGEAVHGDNAGGSGRVVPQAPPIGSILPAQLSPPALEELRRHSSEVLQAFRKRSPGPDGEGGGGRRGGGGGRSFKRARSSAAADISGAEALLNAAAEHGGYLDSMDVDTAEGGAAAGGGGGGSGAPGSNALKSEPGAAAATPAVEEEEEEDEHAVQLDAESDAAARRLLSLLQAGSQLTAVATAAAATVAPSGSGASRRAAAASTAAAIGGVNGPSSPTVRMVGPSSVNRGAEPAVVIEDPSAPGGSNRAEAGAAAGAVAGGGASASASGAGGPSGGGAASGSVLVGMGSRGSGELSKEALTRLAASGGAGSVLMVSEPRGGGGGEDGEGGGRGGSGAQQQGDGAAGMDTDGAQQEHSIHLVDSAVAEYIQALTEQLASAQAEARRHLKRVQALEKERAALIAAANSRPPPPAYYNSGPLSAVGGREAQRAIQRLQQQLQEAQAEASRARAAEAHMKAQAGNTRSLRTQVLQLQREVLESRSAMQKVLDAVGSAANNASHGDDEAAEAAMEQLAVLQQQHNASRGSGRHRGGGGGGAAGTARGGSAGAGAAAGSEDGADVDMDTSAQPQVITLSAAAAAPMSAGPQVQVVPHGGAAVQVVGYHPAGAQQEGAQQVQQVLVLGHGDQVYPVLQLAQAGPGGAAAQVQQVQVVHAVNAVPTHGHAGQHVVVLPTLGLDLQGSS